MKPSFTYDQAAAQMATVGWANAATVPITFGFRASDASDPGFVQFSSGLIDATVQAMALWSDVANIKFQSVGSGNAGSGAYTNSATMLFAGDTDSGGYGWTYFPGDRSAASVDGNVYLNTSGGNFVDLSKGSYEFMALIHEIGHGLGLDHPGLYNGGNPTYLYDAQYLQDSRQYTVMSYFDAEETGAVHGANYAVTPMLHDIAAIQKLYGANTTTRTGDTVYGFNSNADRQQFHITAGSEQVVFTIWDAGGNDTLNFSGYAQNDVINLNTESFSDAGGLKANVSIARGAVIENAIGGSGNDTIIGNAVANNLSGGGGSDDLKGGYGNDHIDGGAGSDTIELKGNQADYTFWLAADGITVIVGDHISARDGYDTLTSVESVHFSDGTFLVSPLITAGAPPDPSTWGTTTTTTTTTGTGGGTAPATFGGDNTVTGTQSNDSCTGGDGDDLLYGLAGRDTLDGGAGFDVLIGGLGKDFLTGGADGDVFEFDRLNETGRTAATRDVITDFNRHCDVIYLYTIDAVAGKQGDQSFTFIGRQAFHHVAGELHSLRYNPAGTAHDVTIVEGDTNGDGRADFQIELKGLLALTKADFIL